MQTLLELRLVVQLLIEYILTSACDSNSDVVPIHVVFVLRFQLIFLQSTVQKFEVWRLLCTRTILVATCLHRGGTGSNERIFVAGEKSRNPAVAMLMTTYRNCKMLDRLPCRNKTSLRESSNVSYKFVLIIWVHNAPIESFICTRLVKASVP
jgi:hypothetical protein